MTNYFTQRICTISILLKYVKLVIIFFKIWILTTADWVGKYIKLYAVIQAAAAIYFVPPSAVGLNIIVYPSFIFTFDTQDFLLDSACKNINRCTRKKKKSSNAFNSWIFLPPSVRREVKGLSCCCINFFWHYHFFWRFFNQKYWLFELIIVGIWTLICCLQIHPCQFLSNKNKNWANFFCWK